MRVSRRIRDVTPFVERYRTAGLSVGLVPTLGALHSGHRSLLQTARRECDRVVATIFLNPTQFGPGEDLEAYPKTPEADLDMCRNEGADWVFIGQDADVYPSGFDTWVEVERLTEVMCGRSRPDHFRGVTTVVTQLLQIAQPHRAYFGQKDYQQSLVIRRLVQDLHIPVDIRVCPTVRETDGCAVSSRNAYLSESERQIAGRLYASLTAGRQALEAGEQRVAAIVAPMRQVLGCEDALRVDYLEVRDASTLQSFADGRVSSHAEVLLAVAAFVGSTRLIDNVLVVPRVDSAGGPHAPSEGAGQGSKD